MILKNTAKKLPILKNIIRYVKKNNILPRNIRHISTSYWEHRYRNGGTSGEGSYNRPADIKARIINNFVLRNRVESVIEFGSGDGNQLSLAIYPSYLGFDVSKTAIKKTKKMFADDTSKSFKLMRHYSGEKADLALSLDVIYHLVEDKEYLRYMNILFSSANKYVIIYCFDSNDNSANSAPHVFHRKFSSWIENNAQNWELWRIVRNELNDGHQLSELHYPDFYIYRRKKI